MFKPIKVNILSNKIKLQTLIPFAEVASSGINFINILLMMRVLNLHQYADYTFIVTIVLWAGVIMDGGISNYIFNKGLQNEVNDIKNLFASRILLFLIVLIALSTYFLKFQFEIAISAIIYIFISFFNINSGLLKMMSRGQQFYINDFSIALGESIIRLILFTILLFIIPRESWNLTLVLLIYLAGSFIAFSINFRWLSTKIDLQIPINTLRQSLNSLLLIISETKFYILYYLILMINNRIEIVYLDRFASKDGLAIYSSARTLLDVIQLFLFSYITSHFFLIYNQEKKYFKHFVFSGLIIIALITVFSQVAFTILFPSTYEEGAKILNIIIFSVIPYMFLYYLLAKINYVKQTQYIYLIILIPLIFKITYYSWNKFTDIVDYSMGYTFFEYFTLIPFVLFFIFNKSFQKIK